MNPTDLPATLRRCDPCRLIFTDGCPIPLCCPRCHRPAPMLVAGPMHRLQAQPPPPWSVHGVAKLADFWAGVFVDTRKRRVYILPVPCLGVWIQLPPAKHRLQTLAETEARRAFLFGRNARRRPGHRWELAGKIMLGSSMLLYLAEIPWAFYTSTGLGCFWWVPSCILNFASVYAFRRVRIIRERLNPPPHWTATCDLDADKEPPPRWPVRAILATGDFLLRCCTPAGRCEACARKPFIVEDLPSHVLLCAECASDLQKLRERRRELAKRRRVG